MPNTVIVACAGREWVFLPLATPLAAKTLGRRTHSLVALVAGYLTAHALARALQPFILGTTLPLDLPWQ